jgi:hypothetical protein
MAKGGSVRWLWAGFTEVLSGEPWVMGDAFSFPFSFSQNFWIRSKNDAVFFFLRSNNDAA